jgi:hypothetical protein
MIYKVGQVVLFSVGRWDRTELHEMTGIITRVKYKNSEKSKYCGNIYTIKVLDSNLSYDVPDLGYIKKLLPLETLKQAKEGK